MRGRVPFASRTLLPLCAALLGVAGALPARAADEELPKFGEYPYIDRLPVVRAKAPPSYPREARAAGVQGTVIVQALVDKEGRVRETLVIRSIPPLDRAAIECVRGWTFEPARADGKPVAVWVAVPIKFALRGLEPAEPAPPRRTRGDSVRGRAEIDSLVALLAERGDRLDAGRSVIVQRRVIDLARGLDSPPAVPDGARAHAERGDSLMRASNPIGARDEYALATRLAPWWADAYRRLAEARTRLGDDEGAVAALRLYLRAAPDARDRREVEAEIRRLSST
jgi:TonB family protein